MKSKISSLALMSFSSLTFAHAGHDHSSVLAALDHVVFYGSIAACVVAGAFIVKYATKSSSKK